MARPKNIEFNLIERIEKLKASGFTVPEVDIKREDLTEDEFSLLPLPRRIQLILGIIRDQPIKATTMNYLILYDIENDKVRSLVSKFLISKACIRIQKSVFLCHSNHKKFDEIKKTLADINDVY